ncbi:valine--tRNA ligase [Candidatus Dependentiae bacterium]|nr:valine--tRNA ligase [Candidatus Dependentiae bacterium]
MTEMMEKKYDHIQAEADAQKLWEINDIYNTAHNPGKLYTIDTPPPTVSGSLHIGHIFSYTQADIIARYKRMNGFSVFYPFGFDDNGLPTEKYVEKKLEINAHALKRSEFIALCLQETQEVEKKFETLWRRIGLSVDWKAHYSTIDERSRFISQLSFIELYKKGFVYRKDEPALFCTTCQTTVAQAELDDLTKTSTFNDILFSCEGEPLRIGTTRPELLAAVTAVFYHPQDTRYTHLAGKMALVPHYNTAVPLLADDMVDPEKGTGLVMCATFGDKMDVMWFKKHKLSYKPIITTRGTFSEAAGALSGMRVASARVKILEILQNEGSLQRSEPISHSVNVHERCKKEIEYLILPQWFLSILEHKQAFIDLGNTIQWYPSFMKSRYINWVENISWDWCLSRQRFYGIPFPAWHCTECKAIVLADINQLPIDPQETPYTGICSCGKSSFTPDTDVMDTWNTSSLTPYITASLYTNELKTIFDEASLDSFIPMSMRPQAHDIIRTWAFDTIVKVWMHNKTIPWNEIVISGHVLSTEKEKISKSKGNSPLAPESLLAQYPADALRYWTASGGLGYDISFSDNQIAIGQKLLIKLWNAFRFAQPYITSTQTSENLGTVNEWILHKSSLCFSSYTAFFEKHEFNAALSTIEQFFWHDFCDNYIELIKDQLLNPAHYELQTVDATRSTLSEVGLKILQLYAPFVPHITETIYGLMYKEHHTESSIHLTKFSTLNKEYSFENSIVEMGSLLELISHVRRLKTEHQLSLKTELAELTVTSEQDSLIACLEKHTQLITTITRSKSLLIEKTANHYADLKEVQGVWYARVTL